ncbi:hypothetical protein H4R34_002296 [Dimargaris verticillata]|uniref:RWD domain-containing protein n=1 Tax=Dimargaris verticillata TaxID=2761393 RepID=A0A9W8E9F4_9FUNG|nr:hypothetical protein H4R34_002296 [Dimargaris verticillata]
MPTRSSVDPVVATSPAIRPLPFKAYKLAVNPYGRDIVVAGRDGVLVVDSTKPWQAPTIQSDARQLQKSQTLQPIRNRTLRWSPTRRSTDANSIGPRPTGYYYHPLTTPPSSPAKPTKNVLATVSSAQPTPGLGFDRYPAHVRFEQFTIPWHVASMVWHPHPSHNAQVAMTWDHHWVVWSLDRPNVPRGHQRSWAPDRFCHRVPGHERALTGLQWSPHNPNFLLTYSMDTAIKLWDLRKRPDQAELSVSEWRNPVTKACFHSSFDTTLVASYDQDIKVWDLRKCGSPVYDRHAHASRVYSLEYDPLGQGLLLSGTLDGEVTLWDTSRGLRPQKTIHIGGEFVRAHYFPTGQGIVTWGVHGDTYALNLYAIRDIENAPCASSLPDEAASTQTIQPLHTFTPPNGVELKDFEWQPDWGTTLAKSTNVPSVASQYHLVCIDQRSRLQTAALPSHVNKALAAPPGEAIRVNTRPRSLVQAEGAADLLHYLRQVSYTAPQFSRPTLHQLLKASYVPGIRNSLEDLEYPGLLTPVFPAAEPQALAHHSDPLPMTDADQSLLPGLAPSTSQLSLFQTRLNGLADRPSPGYSPVRRPVGTLPSGSLSKEPALDLNRPANLPLTGTLGLPATNQGAASQEQPSPVTNGSSLPSPVPVPIRASQQLRPLPGTDGAPQSVDWPAINRVLRSEPTSFHQPPPVAGVTIPAASFKSLSHIPGLASSATLPARARSDGPKTHADDYLQLLRSCPPKDLPYSSEAATFLREVDVLKQQFPDLEIINVRVVRRSCSINFRLPPYEVTQATVHLDVQCHPHYPKVRPWFEVKVFGGQSYKEQDEVTYELNEKAIAMADSQLPSLIDLVRYIRTEAEAMYSARYHLDASGSQGSGEGSSVERPSTSKTPLAGTTSLSAGRNTIPFVSIPPARQTESLGDTSSPSLGRYNRSWLPEVPLVGRRGDQHFFSRSLGSYVPRLHISSKLRHSIILFSESESDEPLTSPRVYSKSYEPDTVMPPTAVRSAADLLHHPTEASSKAGLLKPPTAMGWDVSRTPFPKNPAEDHTVPNESPGNFSPDSLCERSSHWNRVVNRHLNSVGSSSPPDRLAVSPDQAVPLLPTNGTLVRSSACLVPQLTKPHDQTPSAGRYSMHTSPHSRPTQAWPDDQSFSFSRSLTDRLVVPDHQLDNPASDPSIDAAPLALPHFPASEVADWDGLTHSTRGPYPAPTDELLGETATLGPMPYLYDIPAHVSGSDLNGHDDEYDSLGLSDDGGAGGDEAYDYDDDELSGNETEEYEDDKYEDAFLYTDASEVKIKTGGHLIHKATGHQAGKVPFPRLCGAVFTHANGLVCFFATLYSKDNFPNALVSPPIHGMPTLTTIPPLLSQHNQAHRLGMPAPRVVATSNIEKLIPTTTASTTVSATPSIMELIAHPWDRSTSGLPPPLTQPTPTFSKAHPSYGSSLAPTPFKTPSALPTTLSPVPISGAGLIPHLHFLRFHLNMERYKTYDQLGEMRSKSQLKFYFRGYDRDDFLHAGALEDGDHPDDNDSLDTRGDSSDDSDGLLQLASALRTRNAKGKTPMRANKEADKAGGGEDRKDMTPQRRPSSIRSKASISPLARSMSDSDLQANMRPTITVPQRSAEVNRLAQARLKRNPDHAQPTGQPRFKRPRRRSSLDTPNGLTAVLDGSALSLARSRGSKHSLGELIGSTSAGSDYYGEDNQLLAAEDDDDEDSGNEGDLFAPPALFVHPKTTRTSPNPLEEPTNNPFFAHATATTGTGSADEPVRERWDSGSASAAATGTGIASVSTDLGNYVYQIYVPSLSPMSHDLAEVYQIYNGDPVAVARANAGAAALCGRPDLVQTWTMVMYLVTDFSQYQRYVRTKFRHYVMPGAPLYAPSLTTPFFAVPHLSPGSHPLGGPSANIPHPYYSSRAVSHLPLHVSTANHSQHHDQEREESLEMRSRLVNYSTTPQATAESVGHDHEALEARLDDHERLSLPVDDQPLDLSFLGLGLDFLHQAAGDPLATQPVQWGDHPLGRLLVNRILAYYERLDDIQTLCMLSCLLQQPFPPAPGSVILNDRRVWQNTLAMMRLPVTTSNAHDGHSYRHSWSTGNALTSGAGGGREGGATGAGGGPSSAKSLVTTGLRNPAPPVFTPGGPMKLTLPPPPAIPAFASLVQSPTGLTTPLSHQSGQTDYFGNRWTATAYAPTTQEPSAVTSTGTSHATPKAVGTSLPGPAAHVPIVSEAAKSHGNGPVDRSTAVRSRPLLAFRNALASSNLPHSQVVLEYLLQTIPSPVVPLGPIVQQLDTVAWYAALARLVTHHAPYMPIASEVALASAGIMEFLDNNGPVTGLTPWANWLHPPMVPPAMLAATTTPMTTYATHQPGASLPLHLPSSVESSAAHSVHGASPVRATPNAPLAPSSAGPLTLHFSDARKQPLPSLGTPSPAHAVSPLVDRSSDSLASSHHPTTGEVPPSPAATATGHIPVPVRSSSTLNMLQTQLPGPSEPSVDMASQDDEFQPSTSVPTSYRIIDWLRPGPGPRGPGSSSKPPSSAPKPLQGTPQPLYPPSLPDTRPPATESPNHAPSLPPLPSRSHSPSSAVPKPVLAHRSKPRGMDKHPKTPLPRTERGGSTSSSTGRLRPPHSPAANFQMFDPEQRMRLLTHNPIANAPEGWQVSTHLDDTIDNDYNPSWKPLLDPRLTARLDHYRILYADILARWGLEQARCEVYKFIQSPGLRGVVYAQLSSQVVFSNEPLQPHSPANPKATTSPPPPKAGHARGSSLSSTGTDPTRLALGSESHWYSEGKAGVHCVVCRQLVKGRSFYCWSCGHAGHSNHLRTWFAQDPDRPCPTGCGCHCFNLSLNLGPAVTSTSRPATPNHTHSSNSHWRAQTQGTPLPLPPVPAGSSWSSRKAVAMGQPPSWSSLSPGGMANEGYHHFPTPGQTVVTATTLSSVSSPPLSARWDAELAMPLDMRFRQKF